jgi:hypothetical protein
MKGWLAWVEEIVARSGRRVADRDRRVACPTHCFTFMSQPWQLTPSMRLVIGKNLQTSSQNASQTIETAAGVSARRAFLAIVRRPAL